MQILKFTVEFLQYYFTNTIIQRVYEQNKLAYLNFKQNLNSNNYEKFVL